MRSLCFLRLFLVLVFLTISFPRAHAQTTHSASASRRPLAIPPARRSDVRRLRHHLRAMIHWQCTPRLSEGERFVQHVDGWSPARCARPMRATEAQPGSAAYAFALEYALRLHRGETLPDPRPSALCRIPRTRLGIVAFCVRQEANAPFAAVFEPNGELLADPETAACV